MLKLNGIFIFLLSFLISGSVFSQGWQTSWDSLIYFEEILYNYNPHYFNDSDSAIDVYDMHWYANERFPSLIMKLWNNEEFDIDKFSELSFVEPVISEDRIMSN